MPGVTVLATVVVQLQASDGACWEASYAAPVFNDATKFKASE